MRYFVELLGARPVRRLLQPGESFGIGRAADNELRLEHKLVSRRHCRVRCDERGVIVEDLGSRNGTFLNGKRVEGEARARPGDQIRVGSSYLLIGRDTERERRRTPAPTIGGEPLPALPGYEISRRLGLGDTGKIYLARSLVDDREVAIKVLHPAAAEDERRVRRFEREAGVLRQLDHPNIVRVFEVGHTAGLHYYTMERLEGTTLAERLEEGPLSVREALSIGLQIARALELVHAEDVIHRDVSPRNILISRGGIAKLFDFGAIKFETVGANSLTGLGEIVGDLVYSSPEQVRDPRDVDHRTDLYGLGATLYHAMTGRLPIEPGRNHLETVRRVLAAEIAPLRRHVPAVPRRVDDLVLRLLAKEAALRVGSAREVVRELEHALREVCGEQAASANPEDSAQGAFGGGYAGLELLEILQFLEFGKKHGVLTVSAPPLEGELRLRAGLIVGARAGDLAGEDALTALLATTAGTFRFHAVSGPEAVRAGSLEIRPSVAALDAMRRRDERGRAG